MISILSSVIVFSDSPDNPDPCEADTEDYVSDTETGEALAKKDDLYTIGALGGPSDAEVFVTREELVDWEQELQGRVQEARSILGQLMPMCSQFKTQALRDIQTLSLLRNLLQQEGMDSDSVIIIGTSSEEED